MSQVTIQVNVSLSPETLAALENVSASVLRMLRGVMVEPQAEPQAEAVVEAHEDEREDDLAPAGEVIPPATKWSSERVHAMATLRAMKESWADIFEKLNAMPGPKIPSVMAMSTRYSELKRDGKLPVVKTPDAPVRNKVEISVVRMIEDHADKNADVAATDWRVITDWAKYNKVHIEGMVQAAALKKINIARETFGLPLFVVTRAFGPVDALPPPHVGGEKVKNKLVNA